MASEKVEIIKKELETDTLGIGYSAMSIQQVVDSLNALTRPVSLQVDPIIKYLSEQRAKSDEGNDTTLAYLFGRIAMVASAKVGDDPLGTTTIMKAEHIASAKTFLNLLLSSSPSSSTTVNASIISEIDTADITNMLDDLIAAKVMKNPAKTTILGLGNNEQSRARELGIGPVKLGEVKEARSLIK